jgi:membrane protein implicated in regulation of membrane protease activity
MRRFVSFKPKVFAAMLMICAVIAGVASWATGLNFWILAGILVAALLVNGFIASVEDRENSERQD